MSDDPWNPGPSTPLLDIEAMIRDSVGRLPPEPTLIIPRWLYVRCLADPAFADVEWDIRAETDRYIVVGERTGNELASIAFFEMLKTSKDDE